MPDLPARPDLQQLLRQVLNNDALRHVARPVARRAGYRAARPHAVGGRRAGERRAGRAGNPADHGGQLWRCRGRARADRGRRGSGGDRGAQRRRRPGRHGAASCRGVRHDGRARRARRRRRASSEHRGGCGGRRPDRLDTFRHAAGGSHPRARDGGRSSAPAGDRRAARSRHPDRRADAEWGRQALRVAAQNGRVASVRHLLASGADPNVRDAEHGRTALDWCRHERRGSNAVAAHAEIEAMLAPVTS